MQRPKDIVDFTPDPTLFPFESKWFESSVGPIHYIDEGQGRPLFLFHGNPDWSFLYRKMIPLLKGHFRCIAADHPGFGLSVHPEGYGYTPKEHAAAISELLNHLDLQDVVLMGQDWGGPIGMEVASLNADRIGALVMGNTWFWPATDRKMRLFSRLMGSWPLQYLIKKHNFFVKVAMKRSLETPMTDEEFAHYVEVVPEPEMRAGMAEAPKSIIGEEEWLGALHERVVATLSDKPMLLFFGRKDPVVGGAAFIERWKEEFPDATVVDLPNAGHFIQEDAPQEIAEAIIAAYAPSSKQ